MTSYFIDPCCSFAELLKGLGNPQHSCMKIFSISIKLKGIVKGPIDQKRPFFIKESIMIIFEIISNKFFISFNISSPSQPFD